MTVFDLLFLVVFLVTVAGLGLTLLTAVLRQWRYVKIILAGLSIFILLYLGTVILVSLTSPQKVVQVGEEQCSDDWCIAVAGVERDSAASTLTYTVTFRLHSRARGRPQRELGVAVYLVDGQGRRYEPAANLDGVPFDVLLQPGESVTTRRVFELPLDAASPGLVVAHGKFPGIFIIGDGESLFHKETIVRLD